MDMFESKAIAPMLIGKNQQAFDSPEYIYELKLDGIRCLAYIWGGGVELRNKRNKALNAIYPELGHIYKQAGKKCILDGELVALKEGRPDFYEVQRRSLMSNPMKIEIAAKRLPVCFTAFDILYCGGEGCMGLPLMDRKKLLSETVRETPSLAVSRFIGENGVALYDMAAEQKLEGVVAKKADSKYYSGKTTKDWIKMKALMDDDFVVCGFYFKTGNMASVILGGYEGDRLVYQGHVSMGMSNRDFEVMKKAGKGGRGQYAEFPNFEGAVWLVPQLVCRVDFMERTPGGGMRQPVFRGLRDDKVAAECVVKKMNPQIQLD